MLRTAYGPTSLLRSVAAPATQLNRLPAQRQFTSRIWTAAFKRQQAPVLAARKLQARQISVKDVVDKVNVKEEAKSAAKKLTPHPELVSVTSSTHAIRQELGDKDGGPGDTHMMGGIQSDLNTIRETFSLKEVPREAYYLGMAGLIPYLGTSLATVYCAYEINSSAVYGTGFLLSERQAELFLHILEPLQIGYGATIISFLGAIHWGLEFAGYGGKIGYPRYIVGVAGAVLAWPTVLLPDQYALISQFLLFNFLYYTDSRASKRGWAPPWYGVYRFVLTFVVGASIMVSLVGRSQVSDRVKRPHGPTERIRELRESQAENLEAEEALRRQRRVSEDEAEDDEEEAAEDDDQAKSEEEGAAEDDGKEKSEGESDDSEGSDGSKDEGKEDKE